MGDRSKNELLARIAEARRRRAVTGVTTQSLNKKRFQPVTAIVPRHAIRNTAKRPDKIIKQSVANPNGIMFTGGIGDVFAIESFMSETERQKIETIYYATNKSEAITKLFSAMPRTLPNLKNQVVVWNDFSSFWCFYNKTECLAKMKSNNRRIDDKLNAAADFSIATIFDEIHSGKRRFTGSSFLKHKLAEIDRFQLPESYMAVCPSSTDQRLGGRDFDDNDWAATIAILRKHNLKGVILNKGTSVQDRGDDFINLNNSTDITEAIEMLKKAKGYIGIDSSLSVLAAELFLPPNLMIKSVNKHLYNNKDCYYPKQRNTAAVFGVIKAPDVPN